MVDSTLSLPGLSPVRCKPLDVRFDGGVLSPDGGLLLFREVEERLRLADRLAGCLIDPRNPAQVDQTPAGIIRLRMLAIVAGYEDGNDCMTLPLCSASHSRVRSARGWRRNDEINKGTL